MENGIRKRDCFVDSKVFKAVLNGNYPEVEVKKMNNCRLEAFVLKLVKYTSAEAGAKTVSMVNYEKPKWWPRDVLFEKALPNKEPTKDFRLTLRQLVIKCSEFFRNSSFKPKWLPDKRTSWINDENFDGIKTKGAKRKNSDNTVVNGVKRRKTLLSKNESVYEVEDTDFGPTEAIISLQDTFSTPQKSEPLNQQQFLNIFGLSHNNNHVTTTSDVPQFSRYVKLHNCPHIPLSSDVGKAIIKRENYSLPEHVTARRLERLEWYVNKEPSRKTLQNYEVSFAENKAIEHHFYKFPKRQHHQMRCNMHYAKFLLKLCKPLTVVLERKDLVLKKKWYDSFKVTVSVPRISVEQLNKWLCKDLKIVLNKNVHNTRLRSQKRIKLKRN